MIDLDTLAKEIRNKQYRHVVFWLGSILSAGSEEGKTNCPGVGGLRDKLVLAALQRRLASMKTEWRDALSPVVERLLDEGSVDESKSLRKTLIGVLPFERFMGCLADSEPDATTAVDVVRLACHHDAELRPSWQVSLVSRLCRGILDLAFAERVTVVTTNYDRLLECALGQPCDKEESNWEAAWERGEAGRHAFPWFEHRGYATGALTLLKVHGSIEDRESLVFTIAGLARGIVNQDHYESLVGELEAANLWVFAGYGFNDPDLRIPLKRLLRRDRPGPRRVVRIIPKEDGDAELKSGMEVLRHEFLQDMSRGDEYICNLWESSPEQEHFFAGLASRLGVQPANVLTIKWWEHAAFAAQSDRIFSGLTEGAATEFVGRLCDAANAKDAHVALRLLMAASTDASRRVDRAILLCRSLSHQADYDEYIRMCRELRKEWRDPEVDLVTWGFEAFAYTIGRPSVRRALACIRHGRRLLPRCRDPRARATFAHYEGHFWVKLIQYIDVRCCSHPWIPVRLLARPFARRLVRRLHEAVVEAGKKFDWQLMTDVRDIEAQAWIYAGDLDRARQAIGECERDVAALGVPNNMALVDRTRGWIHLARGEALDAQRVFARGTYRSLTSDDTSVWPKLAANLVRVLAETEDLALSEIRGAAHDLTAVEACLKRLALGKLRDGLQQDGWTVAEHLLERYGEYAQALVEHMTARVHLKQCPVYHPPSPPKTQG